MHSVTTGKFKGYSKADQNLTMDDLKELLKSVDHDQVVNSTDVISDEALAALLDRSLSSSSAASARTNEEVAPSGGEVAHSNLFVVLEENTGEGTILKSVNASTTNYNGENSQQHQLATADDNKETHRSPEKQSVAETEIEETSGHTTEDKGETQLASVGEKETERAENKGENPLLEQPAEDEKMRTDKDNQEITSELPPAELNIKKPIAEENRFKIQHLTAAED